MNNNTKNSNKDIPEEVLEILPWYAIGKLSVDDQALFERALLQYPLLQIQLEQELQSIETVSTNKSLLDKSIIANQDERLKAVFNMIDMAETQDRLKNKDKSDTNYSLLDKLKNTINSFIANPSGMPKYARAASVSVLVLSVAVMTAFVAPLFTEKSDFIPASAVTQPLSEKSSLINSSQTVLLVGFKGSSTELGNNKVLKGKLLKIETVPDKEGIYQISFKKLLSVDEIKQTLDALQVQKELIWFAGEAF